MYGPSIAVCSLDVGRSVAWWLRTKVPPPSLWIRACGYGSRQGTRHRSPHGTGPQPKCKPYIHGTRATVVWCWLLIPLTPHLHLLCTSVSVSAICVGLGRNLTERSKEHRQTQATHRNVRDQEADPHNFTRGSKHRSVIVKDEIAGKWCFAP